MSQIFFDGETKEANPNITFPDLVLFERRAIRAALDALIGVHKFVSSNLIFMALKQLKKLSCPQNQGYQL
jgi:pyrimidine operon attenuation protein/uracil phosphoribosyltransferase